MSAGGYAGFGFGNRVIGYLNGAGAMATFIVLGALQRGFRIAQMRKRSAHVGLISSSRLKTHAGNQNHENHTSA